MMVAVPEANALIAERFTREYSVESLGFALDLAAREDKLVDVHCDEIDDEASKMSRTDLSEYDLKQAGTANIY